MNSSAQLSPLQRYRQDLKNPGFSHDPAQEQAVLALQHLYDELLNAERHQSGSRFLGKLVGRSRARNKRTPVKGLYMWGGVGRGKTYLMDNFYESLPFPDKMRAHFHRFMRRVHHQLTALKNEKNPLESVAENIATEARIICFDEFFVTDITDAMILGTLMDQLFQRGVSLVATSNIEPKDLYANGLQRQRFLPTIALINQHTRVINVDGGIDYRLRLLDRAELFHYPMDAAADESLRASFLSLVPAEGEVAEAAVIEIERRKIKTRLIGEDVVWFDFAALCDGPRSQYDYIEIAREFHAVLVSDVPQMGRALDDQARRFINMIDEFYDRNVKLILSADVPMSELYTDGKLNFEFQRTLSRLQEMQSHEYLALPHKP